MNYVACNNADLLALALDGDERAAANLRKRYAKSVERRGEGHRLTNRLRAMLTRLDAAERVTITAPAPAPAPAPATPDIEAIVAAAVAAALQAHGVNTPAPAPVTPEKPRGFADDTLEMVRLHREGMTYDEIALVMGRASGQVVGNAVRRAVKAGV